MYQSRYAVAIRRFVMSYGLSWHANTTSAAPLIDISPDGNRTQRAIGRLLWPKYISRGSIKSSIHHRRLIQKPPVRHTQSPNRSVAGHVKQCLKCASGNVRPLPWANKEALRMGERQEPPAWLGVARRGAGLWGCEGELIRWLETFRGALRCGRNGDISPRNRSGRREVRYSSDANEKRGPDTGTPNTNAAGAQTWPAWNMGRKWKHAPGLHLLGQGWTGDLELCC